MILSHNLVEETILAKVIRLAKLSRFLVVALLLQTAQGISAGELESLAKIPLLSFEQASANWTEVNSEYKFRSQGKAKIESQIVTNNGNRFLRLTSSNIEEDSGSVFLEVCLHGRLNDKKLASSELQKLVNGISFQLATELEQSVPLVVTVRDVDHHLLLRKIIEVDGEDFNEIRIPVSLTDAKSIGIELRSSVSILLDDFNFLCPSTDYANINLLDDQALLSWLSRCSRRYFLDGYEEIEPNKAVVYETSRTKDIVTISGMGFALAAHVLADADQNLPEGVAKQRIACLLNWIANLDCGSGLHGWHGFPNHYLRADGKPHFSKVSTVDWAICSAAIRVVQSYYDNDQHIVAQCDKILKRVDWQKAIDSQNLLVMGFEAANGEIDPYRWGLAFSEETELVCLEAIASGHISEQILNYIRRDKKNGHRPSWFGAGFTYNWLQLWSGPLEGYRENSRAAYEQDLLTCQREFGMPLIGLTACMTVSEVDVNGYARWRRYISNQGSDSHGTDSDDEVIQISPAPYGAALALPFLKQEAINALRAYARNVKPHPMLGLPDSVRIKELPEGVAPIPNWEQVDINIGPMMLAIEQVGKNRIGNLYQKDPDIKAILPKLIESFSAN